jgi:hypothetical protein
MSEISDTLISNIDNIDDNNLTLKYSRQNIQLRRASVLELQSMGESESSIACSLGCSQALISLDVVFLKEMANNKIAEHLGNLAYELDKKLAGLDLLLQKTWGWANTSHVNEQIPVKDKVMILSFISNIYNLKWQLLTDKDPNAIHHASSYVTKAKEELEKRIEWAHMRWEDEDEEELEEEEEEEVNNDV